MWYIWMVLVVWSTKLMSCSIWTLSSEYADTKPGRNGFAPSLRGERPMIKVCPSGRQSSQFTGQRRERHVSSCSATDPGFLPSRGNVNISTVANVFKWPLQKSVFPSLCYSSVPRRQCGILVLQNTSNNAQTFCDLLNGGKERREAHAPRRE